MSRLLANCSTTTTSSASGVATTICDCECEGCCCQYIQYSSDITADTDLIVTFTMGSPDTPPTFGTCLGFTYGEDIWYIGVFFDVCPAFLTWLDATPDLAFNIHITPPPITIPDANLYDCITLIFYDYNGMEVTRCTVNYISIFIPPPT